jgi:hypothetical protein
VERVIKEVAQEDSDIELVTKDVQSAVKEAVGAIRDAVQGVWQRDGVSVEGDGALAMLARVRV